MNSFDDLRKKYEADKAASRRVVSIPRAAKSDSDQEKYDEFDKFGEFNLGGADLFRAKRYANDINHGLEVLENVPKGVSIFGSRFGQEGEAEYDQVRVLGQILAGDGKVVVTGGGPGIMEAANRGAYETGGISVGLKIHLAASFNEPPNPYLTHAATFQYFFARKIMLVNAANLFVFFPGGFGTMDEFTEVLVLLQEQKMPPTPIFLFGSQYWKPLNDFFARTMTERGFLNDGDLELYKITDDINDIVTAARQAGTV
ncbi:cytokinin riboside 5'-monophosphate phosphoribohydrolase [Alphaproteobacteria bacterium]|nr:cytokinin riboside 5'-monophosphate phosphoribohydrolase [Alphaproteobacteria bacterium]